MVAPLPVSPWTVRGGMSGIWLRLSGGVGLCNCWRIAARCVIERGLDILWVWLW
jgi:hypothetical protein